LLSAGWSVSPALSALPWAFALVQAWLSAEAWLLDEPAGEWILLGRRTPGADGHRVDAGRERVTLGGQDRLLVTMEPPKPTPAGRVPVGGAVEASSLFDGSAPALAREAARRHSPVGTTTSMPRSVSPLNRYPLW
jgi:hypothetical protein